MNPFAGRWTTLSQFVLTTCKNRDETHGYEHMRKVAFNAVNILGSNDDQQMILDTITVAWLHDINDHKYDKYGYLNTQLIIFISTLYDANWSQFILDIINRISFSKENMSIKNGITLDWDKKLGIYGRAIRDIVSDADKIEALDINRCEDYILHLNVNIGNEDLLYNLVEHSIEKLLRLVPEFIRTNEGFEIALPLHQKMMDRLVIKINDFPGQLNDKFRTLLPQINNKDKILYNTLKLKIKN
jgi:hypothetical protein